jgi:hypothetical protein
MNLIRLVQAILTRARDCQGSVNKTKLVKYLYLFDLEHFRRFGRTLTGFTWTFHLYGPWTKEFEDFYGEMVKRGDIEVRPSSRPDLDTEFVEAPERVELADVVEDVTLELTLRRIVDTWADRRLGEILDYVYFHTEPMQGGTRGSLLDFSQVERGGTLEPAIQPQPPDRRAIERIRRSIAASRAQSLPAKLATFTPPPYDEHYLEALRIMDDDDGY